MKLTSDNEYDTYEFLEIGFLPGYKIYFNRGDGTCLRNTIPPSRLLYSIYRERTKRIKQ